MYSLNFRTFHEGPAHHSPKPSGACTYAQTSRSCLRAVLIKVCSVSGSMPGNKGADTIRESDFDPGWQRRDSVCARRLTR